MEETVSIVLHVWEIFMFFFLFYKSVSSAQSTLIKETPLKMVDSSLVQVEKNLSEAMKIFRDEQSESEIRTESHPSTRTSMPGPLQGDGQDVSTILHFFNNLIHDEEEEEDRPSQHKIQNMGEEGHVALLGHSLAAFTAMLDTEQLRKLATRILSDTTLWLCRLFRYENGSAYFHEDEREGLVKVCRLVINARYEEYTSEGYAVFSHKQPVIYQSASGRPGLGQHLCSQLGLPLSSLCTVPCNTVFGSQHQMDIALLEKLIKEDVESGKLPLLLIANAGTPWGGHTDKLSRLRNLCDQNSMWLHVEGVNLATLALGQVTSATMAANESDSMTLTPGQWLGLPAITAVTLYRQEDPAMSLAAGLTSSSPMLKLRALPLWLSLQYLGHNEIVRKIRLATELSQLLREKLKTLASIKTLMEDEINSPVVLFMFSQETNPTEDYSFVEKELLDSLNRWLGEQLLQQVPNTGVNVVELEDEGTCMSFSPLLTAADLGTQLEDIESLVEKLSELVRLMSSTTALRMDFRREIQQHTPTLTYVEDLGWPGLGSVRYELQAVGMDESRRQQEVEKINTELLKKLQDLDTEIIFSTGPDSGKEKDCIFVGMVTEDVNVQELVEIIASFGREIEDSGRLLENMTEVVRKGILEAELQLQKDNEEKLMEEGMMRQLPLVGSVLNWFSPVQSSIKGRTFNLAAGSLDSTEGTYSTKVQTGRPPLQDTTASPSMKLPGQGLFKRPSAASDSLSEPNSAEQTPSQPPPEEDSHTESDAAFQTISESPVQTDTQVEPDVVEEAEGQPESQEMDHQVQTD
ncbi:LOW QUALITY PROTEIN: pyridoxal-dependent decarboxylase domain-containing protein 1 [Xyrichtys novacula]|uniref:Pyridoxal-dependent decarboxylase domain-containing protein 1 n=2 Tax=Xyrichtys novacula TaxID=13765 RepID=A0AAV1GP59_XYRNO|nr:LOW QUALITY PROTEIN: pyridoxal-dependent decarboxylase domain-containing protein 1 [Xyrichtys novacula]